MTTGGGQWVTGPGGFAPTGWAYAPPPALKPGTVPLRRLDVGDIVGSVLATLRHYAKPLYLPLLTVALGCSVLIGGCAGAAWALITPLPAHGDRLSTGHLLTVAAGVAVVAVPALICAIVAYAVTAAVSTTVLGHHAVLGRRPLTARQAWAEARPHVWRVLGTQLLTGLAAVAVLLTSALPSVLLGVTLNSPTAAALALPLLIPGLIGTLYLGGRFMLAVPVTVLEDKRPIAATRRAWKLGHGAWWRTVGVASLVRMIGYAATQMITSLAGMAAAQIVPPGDFVSTQTGRSFRLAAVDLILPAVVVGLAVVAAMILRAPVTPLTLGLLYIDRCVRLENLHTDLAAAAVAGGGHRSSPRPDPG